MTIFSVEAFKASLDRGGARPNQFQVIPTFPTWVGSAANALRKGPFLIKSAALPGQVVPPVNGLFYRGRAVYVAGDRQYQPWTISVINDSDFTVRTAFEQWMNGMDDLRAKEGVIRPVEYQTDMLVQQLDRNGSVLKTYKLVEAFPIEISDVGLDFSANDQVSEFTVVLQYQYFEIDNTQVVIPGNP
jgi:hypothetical protein